MRPYIWWLRPETSGSEERSVFSGPTAGHLACAAPRRPHVGTTQHREDSAHAPRGGARGGWGQASTQAAKAEVRGRESPYLWQSPHIRSKGRTGCAALSSGTHRGKDHAKQEETNTKGKSLRHQPGRERRQKCIYNKHIAYNIIIWLWHPIRGQ